MKRIEVSGGLIRAARIFANLEDFLSWHRMAKGSAPDRLVLFNKDFRVLRERVIAALEKSKDKSPPPQNHSACSIAVYP